MVVDFGFFNPPEAIAAFYYAWKASDFKLTLTGSWLTEDQFWWMDVLEYDVLYREALQDAEFEAQAQIAAQVTADEGLEAELEW